MKTIFNHTLTLLACAILFASCAKELTLVSQADADETIPQPEEDGGLLTISATLEDLGTKVSFGAPSYIDGKPSGSMALVWEAGDKLRVYNHADKSQYSDFTLDEGAGTRSASFTGTPVAASSYDVEVIDASGSAPAATVTMASDGVVAGLKYLASATAVTNLTQIAFTNVSSVLAISAKLPAGVAATISSVKMTASEDLFFGGKELTINIATPGDAGSDNILHLFATLPEGDVNVPAGTTILVKFNSTNASHDVYTRFIEMAATTFSANHCNSVNINAVNSATHAGLDSADGSTAAKAYLIGDKYQMQAMSSLMAAGSTKYFKMVDDVDLDGVTWTPLNNATPYSKAIDFDGNNHTVDHLSIDGTSCNLPSFAGVLNGSIHDVTFDHATVACDAKKGGVIAGYIGEKSKGIVGNMSHVEVNHAAVTSSEMCGILGAQGDNVGTVTACRVLNSSVETTASRIGGLIGSVVVSQEISNCAVESTTVTSATYYAGGLIGQFDGGGTVSGCHSSGNVNANHTSYARTGGLIGYIISGNVTDCYSSSTVTVLGQYGAGLIGQIKSASVSKSHATGTVNSSNHFAGGLVGLVGEQNASANATIEKCYYNGTISLPTGSSGKAQAGGIVAYLDASSSATISNCYTSGSWAGRRWFGGIVGGVKADASSLTITNCYTTASITGTPYGALVGANNLPTASVTASGVIAGWASGNLKATGNDITPTSYYIGTESTILEKATEFGWNFTNTWNNTNPPTLK